MANVYDTTQQRQCTKCKQTFPETAEFFQPSPRNRGGLRTDCRQCRRAAKQAWDLAHKKPAKHPENTADQRKCKVCQTVYPLTDEYFHKNANNRYGLGYTCKECAKLRTRNHYQDNREYILQWFRDYYKTNPERAERSKQWIKDNPDKVRAIKQAYIDRDPERRRKQARDYHHNHHEQSLERGREYRRNHPENSRKHKHIRKARILLVEGTFTAQDLATLYEHQDGRCLYCGVSLYWQIPKDIHIEHMIPVSRGGSNYADNLALSCADCNLSKGTKTPDEWFAMRGW